MSWASSTLKLWLLLVVTPWHWPLQTAGVSTGSLSGTPTLPHGVKLQPQSFSMASSILGSPLQLRLYLHWWPFPAFPMILSLRCSPWCLHAFKTSTMWETLTHYQVQLSIQGTAFTPSGLQLLCENSKETLPWRFNLSNAGLLLITSESSALANQLNWPSKAKVSL